MDSQSAWLCATEWNWLLQLLYVNNDILNLMYNSELGFLRRKTYLKSDKNNFHNLKNQLPRFSSSGSKLLQWIHVVISDFCFHNFSGTWSRLYSFHWVAWWNRIWWSIFFSSWLISKRRLKRRIPIHVGEIVPIRLTNFFFVNSSQFTGEWTRDRSFSVISIRWGLARRAHCTVMSE